MQLNPQFIKQLRSERGWTQQQLADICAISLRTVQRVELQGLGSLETCKALAAAFSIPREQLLEQGLAAVDQSPTATPAKSNVWIGLAFITGILAGSALTLWLSR
jgi:transcriptional regulator with XRE-family HTH domain